MDRIDPTLRRILTLFCCALVLAGCSREGDELPSGFVAVKGGTFLMGSDTGEANERPVHRVTVGDFWMAKTEVTQAFWNSLMHTNRTDAVGDQRPVDQVGFAEACEFCNRLSESHGYEPAYRIEGQAVEWDRTSPGFRLPTEAEWEFASRGGLLTQNFVFSGSDHADEVAWTAGNTGSSAEPVGLKKPNELGLYDMSGNVWEWCWDWFAAYPACDLVDPAGPLVGDIHQAQDAAPTAGPMRVGRGGGWSFDSSNARVTARYFAPDYRGWVNGLRPVRTTNPRRHDS